MSVTALLEELEALGAAQIRRIHRRHGEGDELLGVSFPTLGRLRHRFGIDQKFAEAL